MSVSIKRTIGSLALVSALMTGGSLAVATSASAHNVDRNKTRLGTTYTFVSEHRYGETKKGTTGTAAGHAWVRAREYSGTLHDWRHDPRRAQVSGNDFQWTEHKTQENESPVRIEH